MACELLAKTRLVSAGIRCYSSAAEVATVDSSGRVRFVGAGECEVWAKAHDGRNSRHVKVTVG